MALQWLDRVKGYLATAHAERGPMADMYRPLVRAFCLIVAIYYLIVGLMISPFLESQSLGLAMALPRVSICLVAGLAFYLTRAPAAMHRLELAAIIVSLHILTNFAINELTEFDAYKLSTFEIIVALIGATLPTLRGLIFCLVAAVVAWLWLVHGHDPGLMKPNIGMAIASSIVACLIWGLINHALRNARKALAVAEQRGDELERFAYICSHDMQEPVRMMNVYSGFLSESLAGKGDEDSERYLVFIRTNAQRMQQMIRDILAFSRVGRDTITIEPVDANAVLAEVLAKFETHINESNARVTTGPLPVIETSATMMHVVLQNLIGNALKYQDGRRLPEISVSALEDKGMWRFSVRDNGIGIDPAYGGKIFTLFQRLNRKEDYPGTGIGLSTCRKFLRLCDGDIDFDSRPGEGSNFYFTLPRKAKPRAPTEETGDAVGRRRLA